MLTPILKTLSTPASKETEWTTQNDYIHTTLAETVPLTIDGRDYKTIYPEVYRNNEEHAV